MSQGGDSPDLVTFGLGQVLVKGSVEPSVSHTYIHT